VMNFDLTGARKEGSNRGGWPSFAGTITIEAAPALLLLQSWAPRTSLPCSFVTDELNGTC
jgi:hypothetical protein